eukprot:TRINITY_DN9228_c0_g1_i1.p1 TRINITY_DN9228_c0_g1~~TRINITY_DN9228_c0_g1_i1.p1  ORF type:complete len:655 (-),score=82.37 TRINITY_DN9228_c0_g1_i1:76-1992(-)
MARQMMINPEQRTLLQHVDDYPEPPEHLDLRTWDSVRILDLVDDDEVAGWAKDLFHRWDAAKRRLMLTMTKLKDKDAMQKGNATENQLSREKVNAMEEMRELGKRLTPQQFVVALTVLNQEKAIEFLRSMSFELNKDEWSEWRHLENEDDPRDTVEPYLMQEDASEWAWPLHNDRSRFSTFRTAFFGGIAGQTIGIHWMPATRILNPSTNSDETRIMSALQNIGSEGGAFVTPVGWSILNRTWRANYGHFRRARIVDALYLIMLWTISYHCVHCTKYEDGQEIPPRLVDVPLLVIAMLLTLRNIVRQLAELIGCVVEFQRLDEAFVQTCTLWNTILFLFEVSTAIIMCQLLYREVNCHSDIYSANCNNSSSFHTMSVRYSLVVGTKWISSIMALLCMDAAQFGRSVFPALHAITRMESLAFMATLMLSVIGAFHTYTAFPIAENVKVSEWFAFMKVFQFALLGNFDVWDLEGVDPVINGEIKGNATHTNFSGSMYNVSMDDGEVKREYHGGVMIFVMFLGITVTILSMNVAIGVVSDLYSQAKSNSLQIHSHYKAGYLFRLQLQNHVLKWTSNLDVCCPEDEIDDDMNCFLCSVVAADVPGDHSDGNTGLETLKKRMDSLESLISKLHLQLSNNARLG